MKKVMPFLIGLSFILLFIVYGILFDGNHIPMFILTLSSVFLVSIFYLKKKENISVVDSLILVLPLLVLFIITGILGEDFSRAIQYIIFIPISSLLAYLYLKTKKLVIIPISLILFYCIGTYLFVTLFTYVSNINAEKKVDFPNIDLVDNNGEKITFDKDKIIVLDFWSTSCGICFEKFPDLQATADKYNSNKRVEIYAVNFPLKRDKFEKTVKILDSIGYKFPKLYAKSSNQIEDSLNFNTFPHLLILKDGKIRYDGMMETKKNTMVFSIESQIDKLIKE